MRGGGDLEGGGAGQQGREHRPHALAQVLPAAPTPTRRSRERACGAGCVVRSILAVPPRAAEVPRASRRLPKDLVEGCGGGVKRRGGRERTGLVAGVLVSQDMACANARLEEGRMESGARDVEGRERRDSREGRGDSRGGGSVELVVAAGWCRALDWAGLDT